MHCVIIRIVKLDVVAESLGSLAARAQRVRCAIKFETVYIARKYVYCLIFHQIQSRRFAQNINLAGFVYLSIILINTYRYLVIL